MVRLHFPTPPLLARSHDKTPQHHQTVSTHKRGNTARYMPPRPRIRQPPHPCLKYPMGKSRIPTHQKPKSSPPAAWPAAHASRPKDDPPVPISSRIQAQIIPVGSSWRARPVISDTQAFVRMIPGQQRGDSIPAVIVKGAKLPPVQPPISEPAQRPHHLHHLRAGNPPTCAGVPCQVHTRNPHINIQSYIDSLPLRNACSCSLTT